MQVIWWPWMDFETALATVSPDSPQCLPYYWVPPAAAGSSQQYQWAKNGAAIAGATGSTYVTPATAFADTGSSFTVTVSNSAGSVTSNAASLTVTARAPMADDLRFQQVDAPSLPHLISNRPIFFSGSRGFNPRNKTALS
jgi:hypothetical protein